MASTTDDTGTDDTGTDDTGTSDVVAAVIDCNADAMLESVLYPAIGTFVSIVSISG